MSNGRAEPRLGWHISARFSSVFELLPSFPDGDELIGEGCGVPASVQRKK